MSTDFVSKDFIDADERDANLKLTDRAMNIRLERMIEFGKTKNRSHLAVIADDIIYLQMYLDAMGYKGHEGEA